MTARETSALLLWLLGATLGAVVLAWPKRLRGLVVLLLTGCAGWIGYALLSAS